MFARHVLKDVFYFPTAFMVLPEKRSLTIHSVKKSVMNLVQFRENMLVVKTSIFINGFFQYSFFAKA
jgi:hypothetical protein